jgi:hypothetical protein
VQQLEGLTITLLRYLVNSCSTDVAPHRSTGATIRGWIYAGTDVVCAGYSRGRYADQLSQRPYRGSDLLLSVARILPTASSSVSVSPILLSWSSYGSLYRRVPHS